MRILILSPVPLRMGSQHLLQLLSGDGNVVHVLGRAGWGYRVGDTGVAEEEEQDTEGHLVMGTCTGVVLVGEGQSGRRFLGSGSVTDQPRQARRAAVTAPRDIP